MKQHIIRLLIIVLLFVVFFTIATLIKSRPVEKHGLGAIPSNQTDKPKQLEFLR